MTLASYKDLLFAYPRDVLFLIFTMISIMMLQIMQAFRKATAASLERNKTKLKDVLAAKKQNMVDIGTIHDEDSDYDDVDHDKGITSGKGWNNTENDRFLRDSYSDMGDSFIDGTNNSGNKMGVSDKIRLNIAERKKLKKKGATLTQMKEMADRKALMNKLMNTNTDKSNTSEMGFLETLETTGN